MHNLIVSSTGHRQADSTAIASIVRNLAAERCSNDSQDARVVLEMPQPNRLNGKWSWYACGHSFGVWHGALTSQGFKVRCGRGYRRLLALTSCMMSSAVVSNLQLGNIPA